MNDSWVSVGEITILNDLLLFEVAYGIVQLTMQIIIGLVPLFTGTFSLLLLVLYLIILILDSSSSLFIIYSSIYLIIYWVIQLLV